MDENVLSPLLSGFILRIGEDEKEINEEKSPSITLPVPEFVYSSDNQEKT